MLGYSPVAAGLAFLPTTLVNFAAAIARDGLRWQHWGSGTTVGYGQGWCPGRSVASGHYCTTSLHVYDLVTCEGRRAHRMMALYFKPAPHRHWIVGAK